MHIYFLGQKGLSSDFLQDPAEVRTAALAHQAASSGHTATVAVTNTYIGNGLLSLTGIRLAFFPSFDPRVAGGYLYAFLSSLASLVIRPDVVLVQGWKTAFFMRLALPFLPKTCAVWTIDSLTQTPSLEGALKFFLPFISSGFDQICSTSRTIQYRLLTSYGLKTAYIPDGYMPPALEDISVRPFGLTKEKYAVVLARNPKEIRGIAKAFAAAKTRKKLVAIGNGRSSAAITYIDAPITSRAASSIIHQAGVVIAADPAYSRLLLTAMDAGRQVIATTDSLHEELLGVSAQYYVAKDMNRLSSLIKTALKNLSKNRPGAYRSRHHFTWTTIGQEYARAYTHTKRVLVPFDSIIRKESFKIAA